jgi:D-alanine transaminase
MPRIAYVNGRFAPLADASVHVEDRGYQFADGAYEVIAVLNGRLLDLAPHLDRLEWSLSELAMAMPMARRSLEAVIARLLLCNRARDALLYVQVTRGVARRDHAFPATRPALVMTVRPFDFAGRWRAAQRGVAVALRPDERWARPDIKSVSLLPNVLAKEAARRAGAFEAWFVGRDGMVTEGSSTNAWIVTGDGTVVTRPRGRDILAGVMRALLLRLAGEGVRMEERPFSPGEAQAAAEAFLTSTTNPCLPVVALDGQPVGDGTPGPVTRRLRDLVWAEIRRQTGWQPTAP